MADPWARAAEPTEPAPGAEAEAAGAGVADAGVTDAAAPGPADDAPPAAPAEVTLGMYINQVREVNLRELFLARHQRGRATWR